MPRGSTVRVPYSVASAACAAFLLVTTSGGCNQMASTATNVDGVRLYEQGDYLGARQRFTDALAKDPSGADAYYNLAATYHRLGALNHRPDELRQAEGLYNQCLDRDPDHAACHRGLAVLLYETGRPDSSKRLLEGWAVRNPTSPAPKIEMARLLEETGDKERAELMLHEALTVDPDNARALTALGKLREDAGDLQQALADYRRSLAVNGNQPQVQARVATLQAQLGGGMHAATPAAPAAQTVTQPQSPTRHY